GGALMWVLAVAQMRDLCEGEGQPVRQRLDVAEPAGDRRLVRGRSGERFRRQRTPSGKRELDVLAQLREHGVVLLRPANRRAVSEVLRRAAQHRRTADV